jgi:hypothetical protein
MKEALVAVALAYLAVSLYGKFNEKRTFVCDVETNSPKILKCRQVEEPKE